MAFTQDEIQSLHTIIEQTLATQQRDLERTFEQKSQKLQHDFEQRLLTMQGEFQQTLSRQLDDQHTKLATMFQEQLNQQPEQTKQASEQKPEMKNQQQNEDLLERSLAAQLLAFEQIINQHFSSMASTNEFPLTYTADGQPEFDAIEVQTEIPWEEMAELIDQTLGAHLSPLRDALISSMYAIQEEISQQLQTLRDALLPSSTPYGRETNIAAQDRNQSIKNQEVIQSIDRLEHLVEALQVSMTSNNALLSNRLYHHQQLPLERAHPSHHVASQPSSSPTTEPEQTESPGISTPSR
ncbi:hypothetical protein [Dictyobacter arantiisoli]|uniref:Uncharacterized protein n=1 Tax=Dictyobacter arantiisoli TaxID=2014874 RepID=A0A5A5TK20_9CHLR|nr:hypothetical protein [Dictyobacter arantiisoli]GCF11981.1 hypothetical protein KDI_55450 [Dictyobacter arantiisoli]